MPTTMIFYVFLVYLITNKFKKMVWKNIFNENEPLIQHWKVKLYEEKQTLPDWWENCITITCKSLFSSHLFQIQRK